MKETIYTIPVHDAYLSAQPCPLCFLSAQTQEELLGYYLGPAVMESDVRLETNKKGFCQKHWRALYLAEENRLGLGLLLHTHIESWQELLEAKLSVKLEDKPRNIFSKKKGELDQKIEKIADELAHKEASCLLCERINYTMNRYIDVILHQFFHDPTFQKQFTQKQDYCLPHFLDLLRAVAANLSSQQQMAILAFMLPGQKKSMNTLSEDVEWFTLKFDYRNSKADWKNSKDALPRAINHLTGQADLE